VSCSLSGGTGLQVKNKMILHPVRTMYAEMAILLVTAGTLQQAYLEKSPLSALVAFAIAGGWDQTSFMRRHFCGRALVSCCDSMHAEIWTCIFSVLHNTVVDLQVPVPHEWIDSLFPEVRRILECVKARNARLQSAKPQTEDRVSDRAAEGFLQTVLYAGICFWQNLPFRTERYVHDNRTCLRTWTERQMKRMRATSSVTCRYGMSYILHQLPAVASIMVTQEYSQFANQVWSSHNKANKQAELDVSAGMGDMLQDMQACLKQLCGGATVGEPEAVARIIAENISAMNISSNAADVQGDSVRGVLTSPGSLIPVTAPASGTECSRASLIQAPSLYDTSGSINSVSLAWQEWRSGPANSTIAQRVEIKAHKHMSLGRRNTHLHKKNRHLPQLIESLVGAGASAAQAVNLMTHIAQHLKLSLDQLREGSRLLVGKTAKTDSDSLTAETTVTLGDFKAAVGWANAQVALLQAHSSLMTQSH